MTDLAWLAEIMCQQSGNSEEGAYLSSRVLLLHVDLEFILNRTELPSIDEFDGVLCAHQPDLMRGQICRIYVNLIKRHSFDQRARIHALLALG